MCVPVSRSQYDWGFPSVFARREPRRVSEDGTDDSLPTGSTIIFSGIVILAGEKDVTVQHASPGGTPKKSVQGSAAGGRSDMVST